MGELELLLKVSGTRDTGSPFERALRRVAGSGPLDLACPYLSVGLLRELMAVAPRFRLVTDAEEWLRAFARPARQEILAFIAEHSAAVRHHRDLHAKVALSPTLAMFGSANFTERGMFERQEVGALVDDARRAALEEGDRRLVTSMQRNRLAIGITINNRWVLGALRASRDPSDEPEIYVLDPAIPRNALPAPVRKSIVGTGHYGPRPGDIARPPRVLWMRDFSFRRSRAFLRAIERACAQELPKARRSSNAASHSRTLFRAATSHAYRQRLFARVDWASA